MDADCAVDANRAAACEHGLAALLAAFPDEVSAALALARAQRAALAAMRLDAHEAP